MSPRKRQPPAAPEPQPPAEKGSPPALEAKLLYTVPEVARLLSISEHTCYRWLLRAESGRGDGLRSVKIGGLRRIRHDALIAFIAAHTPPPRL